MQVNLGTPQSIRTASMQGRVPFSGSAQPPRRTSCNHRVQPQGPVTTTHAAVHSAQAARGYAHPDLSDDPTTSRRALLAASAGAAAAGLLLPSTAAAAATAAVGSAALAQQVPRTQIAPGLDVSRVIKGCWQLSGGHHGDKQSDRTSGRAAVEDFQPFVDRGITTFDAADHYGPAEALIGRYLKEAGAESRARCQVLTKYCVFSGAEMSRISARAVKDAVDVSRQRLGLDTVDLMQFYWGDYSYGGYVDASLHLTELQAQGALKGVGLTNFDVKRTQQMLDAGAQLVSNQVQYSLLDTRPENGMADFCAAHNMWLLPYGVLAGGLLSKRYLGVPAAEVRADTYSKGKYARVISERGGWDWFQTLLKVLDSIATKHNSTISNVAARWVLDKPRVAGVILGARNASHVPEQASLFSLALDDEDRAAINGVLQQGRRPRGDCYSWERGGVW